MSHRFGLLPALLFVLAVAGLGCQSTTSEVNTAAESTAEEGLAGFWGAQTGDRVAVVEFRADGVVAVEDKPDPEMIAICDGLGFGDIARGCQSRWSGTGSPFTLERAHLHNTEDGGCGCQLTPTTAHLDGDTLTIEEDGESFILTRVER